MGGDGSNGLLEQAQHAVDSVQADPERARGAAESLLSRDDLTPETAAVAWWAVGLAARQVNQLDEGLQALNHGLGIATENGLSRREGQIRSSLALVLLYQGDSEGALLQGEKAAENLSGGDRARNEMQLGLILQRLGRLDEALTRYRKALTGLRRAGDRLAEARLLANRGVLHGYRGELEAGVADLTKADRIARELGQHLIVAGTAHNLGFLEGRRGDVPAALAWFDEAERAYEAMGRPPGMVEVLEANRAELLLSVGLVSEAMAAVRTAIAGLERSGNVTDLAETRLLAAEVALADERLDEAAETAALAAAAFNEQERPSWERLARYQELRARLEAGVDPGAAPSLIHRAEELAVGLAGAGLVAESHHTRLLMGRLALVAGDLEAARRNLRKAAAARSRGPAVGRARAWYAEALLRDAEGNPKGSQRAVEAGLRLIRDYRASLGASELRAHAATHGLELARLALHQAMESGSAWRVLKALESWRAVNTQLASVRPPRDAELAVHLAELRRVDAEIREAATAGERTNHLLSQRTALETTVKSVTRRLHGSVRQPSPDDFDRDRVSSALADATLVSYFVAAGHLHAVTMTEGSLKLTRIAPAEPIRNDVSSLVFSLHRLAHGSGSAASQEAAEAAVVATALQLGRTLIESLEVSPRHLVVIPTGVLHRLPWCAITGTATTISPSLTGWLAAKERLRPLNAGSPAALVAGPGLPGAVAEVAHLAHIYTDRRRLTRGRATTASVLGALEAAQVAHIAAHGTFRTDNPLFSSLLMSDGPLTVYDLEQLDATPSVMVLSACDTAVSKVVAGGELLGLSAALLGLGTSSLVAPVVPIPDDAAVGLMGLFHKGLATGYIPAQALSEAIMAVPDDTPQQRAVRASFVALGA